MNVNKYNEQLLISINDMNRNTLIIGPAGYGKSSLIHWLTENRDDIILTAPSGIAAQNIGGRTIQSFFNIRPNTFTFNNKFIYNFVKEKIDIIRNSSILLIDEISMLRCEILDILDYKLKLIKENRFPFGGMKLLFVGDFCQMEPVVQWFEKPILNVLYPHYLGDFNFYAANVMVKNNLLERTFDIFQIDEDYRHIDDTAFRDMLSNIRLGKITENQLNKLNNNYKDNNFVDENYQYLTVTRAMAKSYNSIFTDKLEGKLYASKAKIEKINPIDDYIILNFTKPQFYDELKLKENMKVMFVKNDGYNSGQRWVNGTIGIIKKINYDNISNEIVSIKVLINGENEVDVKRDKIDLSCNYDDKMTAVATMEQFPLIPAWAITIDKSQGLTLDKITVVMEKINRDNQMYVALSRVRKLEDIVIVGRKIRQNDVRLSKTTKAFLDRINHRIIHIKNNESYQNNSLANTINNQYITINNNSNGHITIEMHSKNNRPRRSKNNKLQEDIL